MGLGFTVWCINGKHSNVPAAKRIRVALARRANPSRGGDAKPMGLLEHLGGSRAVEQQRWGNDAPPLEGRGCGCGPILATPSYEPSLCSIFSDSKKECERGQ